MHVGCPDPRYDKKRKPRDSDREEGVRRDTLKSCGMLVEMNSIQLHPSGSSTREAPGTEAAWTLRLQDSPFVLTSSLDLLGRLSSWTLTLRC